MVETIDIILTRIGVGKFNIMLLIILGCHFAAFALQILIIATIGPILSCYWKLNTFDIYIFATTVLFGMLIGNLMVGYFGDKYGRKTILILSNCCLIYCGIMSAISPTFYWFTIMQFLTGIIITGLNIAVFPIMSEFSPIRHRGTFITLFQCFWAFGSLYGVLLSYLIVPTLGWRIFLIINTLQIVILSIFLVYIPESPRYLLLNNQKAKCIKIINYVAKMNGSDPITDLYEPPQIQSSIFELIHPMFLSTTILTSIMSFIGNLTLYGVILLTTYIGDVPHRCLQNRMMHSQMNKFIGNNTVDDSCCFIMTWKNYQIMLISISAEILFVPVSIVLINSVGRKKTFAICTMINAVGIFLLNFCLNTALINVLLFFVRGSCVSYINLFFLYVTEVYSTSIRCFGIGACNTTGRIGAMLAPLILVIFLKLSFLSGTLILVVLNLIGFVISFILPYETKDRQLMQSVDDNSNNSDKIILNDTNYQTYNK